MVLVLGVGERWGVAHAAFGKGKEEMIEPLRGSDVGTVWGRGWSGGLHGEEAPLW